MNENIGNAPVKISNGFLPDVLDSVRDLENLVHKTYVKSLSIVDYLGEPIAKEAINDEKEVSNNGMKSEFSSSLRSMRRNIETIEYVMDLLLDKGKEKSF